MALTPSAVRANVGSLERMTFVGLPPRAAVFRSPTNARTVTACLGGRVPVDDAAREQLGLARELAAQLN